MDKILKASWRSRIWAWIIDVLIISIPWYMFIAVQGIEPASLLGLGYHNVFMFLYWTMLEGHRGQSLGKMVQNIATVGPYGESIRFQDAAIESFGKAFLLPLDCLIGWLAWTGSGQRLFNKISDTVVAVVDDESI